MNNIVRKKGQDVIFLKILIFAIECGNKTKSDKDRKRRIK